jgi:hypothetical protein
MPAMTKAEWLAAFGRLMLEVQEFERGLVVLLVAEHPFKNSEAAFAAVEAGDFGRVARVLSDLVKLLDTDVEREFFRLSVRLRNVVAHWYFRLREFDPSMLTLGEDLARLTIRMRTATTMTKVLAERLAIPPAVLKKAEEAEGLLAEKKKQQLRAGSASGEVIAEEMLKRLSKKQ